MSGVWLGDAEGRGEVGAGVIGDDKGNGDGRRIDDELSGGGRRI